MITGLKRPAVVDRQVAEGGIPTWVLWGSAWRRFGSIERARMWATQNGLRLVYRGDGYWHAQARRAA